MNFPLVLHFVASFCGQFVGWAKLSSTVECSFSGKSCIYASDVLILFQFGFTLLGPQLSRSFLQFFYDLMSVFSWNSTEYHSLLALNFLCLLVQIRMFCSLLVDQIQLFCVLLGHQIQIFCPLFVG